MNQKIFWVLTFISLTAALISLTLTIGYQKHKKDIGFVDITKLVEAYQMKKDLEKLEESRLHEIKSISDSLGSVYGMAKKNPGANAVHLKTLEANIQSINIQFEAEYNQSNLDINQKVWGRLNQAINEYAGTRDMQLLVGADGKGTVLYGDIAVDHTDELIKFVNSKYQNGN
jgi:outer membrane protein